jgi:inosine-uridine nucleoside N-ribohydrolase
MLAEGPTMTQLFSSCSAVLLTVLMMANGPVRAKDAVKTPILLDTDIGGDIDDAYALALVLASPELDLRGVTTVGAGAEDRAWIVCRFLTAVGRRNVPVAWGRGPQPGLAIEDQIQYRRHPAVIFNRTARPVKDPAVEFLYARLKAEPGKLTVVTLGPLTNVARLVTEHPDSKPWIKRIVLMGGSLRTGYDGKPGAVAEWNIKTDVPAAQAVMAAGIPLAVVPLDASANLKLDGPLRRRLFAACTPLTFQVQALDQLWGRPAPTLFDPAAVAFSFDEGFFKVEDLRLEVDDRGFTPIGKGKPNARVATAVRGEELLKWYVNRVAAGPAVLPRNPPNPSRLIPPEGMPTRVHAFEDYETDIERRWWMSGVAETKNVPPGSSRACRGVLIQDFDDLMGDMKTMYTAVIFNPVPGPPMGKNPRLRFRYWLKGTDTLRVQIYSLTKGYHRCLTLTGLPEQKWQEGTVDMTRVRRPDGSGGALSENERIDDIQFYVDPRAELLIDDIVLYDAPGPGEKRPFPVRLLYTGLFDTGKQGKEWPGDFEIVDKRGYFWKAARSVPGPGGRPCIRLNLRGPRPAGETTELFFRYHLSGADRLRVAVVKAGTKEVHTVPLTGLKQGAWAEATVNFNKDGAAAPSRKDRLGEIRFLLPDDAELLADDVLLYAPP